VIALALIVVVCNRLIGNQLLTYLAAAALGGLALSGILGDHVLACDCRKSYASAVQIAIAFLFARVAISAG
jgi:hypothetical protein